MPTKEEIHEGIGLEPIGVELGTDLGFDFWPNGSYR
jgi:hypothetical protein